MNDILKLSIESNAFAAMKQDFDKVLKRTLENMQVKDSKEASLTLKLNITLEEDVAPDFQSSLANATRKVVKPSFDHTISSVMQIKTKENGSFKGEYELVWDEEVQNFVMKPIGYGQGSIFDDDSFYADDSDNYEDEATPDIPMRNGGSYQDHAEDSDEYDYDEPEE